MRPHLQKSFFVVQTLFFSNSYRESMLILFFRISKLSVEPLLLINKVSNSELLSLLLDVLDIFELTGHVSKYLIAQQPFTIARVCHTEYSGTKSLMIHFSNLHFDPKYFTKYNKKGEKGDKFRSRSWSLEMTFDFTSGGFGDLTILQTIMLKNTFPIFTANLIGFLFGKTLYFYKNALNCQLF